MSKQIRLLLTRLPAFIFSTPTAPTGLPAPFVPANTSCDSASAGNKCPSFTVCWLIYNNYTSLCSRENDQIVWDESIKSLLSGGVSLLGVMITIRWACSGTETCVRKPCLFPEADSANATRAQPDAEKRAIDSQTKCLRLHKLSSSNFSNHNILPVIADSREATFWHATQPLVLSDFRELKRLCCQTSNRNTTKEPKTLQLLRASAPHPDSPTKPVLKIFYRSSEKRLLVCTAHMEGPISVKTAFCDGDGNNRINVGM